MPRCARAEIGIGCQRGHPSDEATLLALLTWPRLRVLLMLQTLRRLQVLRMLQILLMLQVLRMLQILRML